MSRTVDSKVNLCELQSPLGATGHWRRMLAISVLLCASMAAGQGQSGSSPDGSSESTKSQTVSQSTNPLQSGVAFFRLLQRKSLVFPDLATNSGVLNTWQKFELAANNSASLATISSSLIASAFGQAINIPAGYGQGGEGFAKRFGAHMARAASGNLFGTFLIASALHEDPRFYVQSNLGFKASLKYAAVRLVYTRSDSGDRVANFAGLLGPLAGEGLANVYYPEGSRGAGSTFIRYASDLGWVFGGNMLRQYWPKINKKLRLVPDTRQ
jgi:hypothetical protein